jgi:hypothetical protein
MKIHTKIATATVSFAFLFSGREALAAPTTFGGIFGASCTDYNCWINAAWNWVATVSIPAAAVVIMIAGLIYSTSGGSPDKIGQAKKMIFAALSGIAILLLAKIFLVTFLGIDSSWNIT